MQLRKRILLLLSIMIVVTSIIGITAVSVFYQATVREKRKSLSELVTSQSRLMESLYRYNKKLYSQDPNGAKKAAYSQLIDAHEHYESFSATGEILIAEKKGDKIHFIFGHQQDKIITPDSISTNLGIAEPMLLALAGQAGTVKGNDYTGYQVLAAYGYVAGLDCGIVAKIDISEIRLPFIRAIYVILLVGILVISIGMTVFFRISNPILKEMGDTIENLNEALTKVKLLGGLLPICASCKKIRDDKGYWNQIESYIKDHSEAEFSHGICPECAEKLYPEFSPYKK
ncbi:MAG: hypothetical protein L6301_10780 [Desulfobacteraceae bacterium]|nr:hypothetical protein [Desulfobacteraceae bacterium]